MNLSLRNFLLVLSLGFTLTTPPIWATDFTCVENYREWNDSYFDRPNRQPHGTTAFQREDAHRIYSIYRDIENRRYQSEDVRGMLNFLAVPPEKEVAVISAFVKILESGEACVDDKPSKSWVEILNILRPLAY